MDNKKYYLFTNMISSLLILILFPHTQQKPVLDAKQHLHTYGFLNSLNPDAKTLQAAVKKFQQVTDLEVTGTLNKATLEMMATPRCGMASNLIPESAHALGDFKWSATHLTYRIVNWSEPFTNSDIRNVFEDAIMQWTDDVNLKVTESDSRRADILVHFSEQDGPSNVVGYAEYPEGGDIFFDKDEEWTLDRTLIHEKIYFPWVAIHELGHALGLPHSEVRGSIMFPYYSSDQTGPTALDIQDLRSLYGRSVMNNSVLCSGTSIDAILDTKEPMIIKGRQYWVLSDGHIQSGPLALQAMYPNVPQKVDAAFMVGKTSYFLADMLFYKFDHNSKRSSHKYISAGFDGIPANIDAAFYHSGGSAIYFFKGSKYYKFDVKKPVGARVTINGKDISNDWGGVPKNLDAASLISNSRVLFTKGSECYVVDLDSREQVSSGDCASVYYGC